MSDLNLSDLLPAYALDALSEAEKAQVEAWLATSEEARTELREYQAMLTTLALLSPPRRASPHLTEDFKQRLAAESGESRVSLPKAVIRFRRTLMGLAAVLLIGIALFAIYQRFFADPQGQAIHAILKNPDAAWITLQSQGGTGTVTLVTVPNSPQAVLVASLPPLDSDKQYELWVIGDQPVNSGVFQGSTDQVLVTLPNTPEHYKIAAITIEPNVPGGVAASSNKPIFVGELKQQ